MTQRPGFILTKSACDATVMRLKILFPLVYASIAALSYFESQRVPVVCRNESKGL